MTILIIEDDLGLAELIKEKVAECGYETVGVNTAGEALAWLSKHTPYIMLLDYSLPDMNAKEFISELQGKEGPLPPFIVLTGQGDERIAVDMMKIGARDYIIKDSVVLDKLPEVIRRVDREIENENKRKQAEEALWESGERFQQLVEQITDVIFEVDHQGVILYFSPVGKDVLGYDEEEVAGKNFVELVHPDDRDIITKRFVELSTGVEAPLVYRVISKAGEIKWVRTKTKPRIENGIFVGGRGVLIDITDRKQIEAQLISSKQLLQDIIDNTSFLIYAKDLEGKFILVSQSLAELFGHPREHLFGKTSHDFFPQEIADHHRENDLEVMKLQRRKDSEESAATPDGIHTFLSTKYPLYDADGKMYAVCGISTDITNIKRTEAMLRLQSEIMANMAEAVYLVRMDDGVIVYTNSVFEQMFGYKEGEMLGKNASIVNSPIERNPEEIAKEIMAAVHEEGSWQGEIHNIRKDGTHFWSYASCSLFDHSTYGRVIVTFHIDITERKQMEEALESSLSLLSASLESTADGILIVDSTGKIVRWNQKFADMWKIPEEILTSRDDEKAINHILSQLAKPMQFTDKVRELYEQPEESSFDQIEFSDGRVFERYSQPQRIADKVAGRVWSFRDITERKRAEEGREKLETQNRQLHKSESLTRMAASIAHHFNNQLGAVIGNLEMAMDELPKAASTHQTLTKAMQSAWTAADMSGLMLTYLGQTHEEREPLDLSYSCNKILPLIKTTLPENVVMETDFQLPKPIIMANNGEIQQIITNLITNAWESIGNNKGNISLSVKTVSPAEIPTKNRFPIDWQTQDKTFACLEVTDTGSGIESKDIEKLFDPFFSTKFTGRGMGLAVVLGLANSYKGVITVESKPGKGSTFRIFFPVSEEALRQPQEAEIDRDVPVSSRSPKKIEEGGTVLVVEDEEMLRDMAAAMLESFGFTVLKAKDGIEALEIFGKHQSEIKFVITDLTMPRMNGWETLTALRKLQSNIPAILASGYDLAHVMEGVHPELPQAFLAKPYNLKALRDAVSQTLAITHQDTKSAGNELVRK